MEKVVWLGKVGSMAATSQKQARPRQKQLECGLNTARPRLNITLHKTNLRIFLGLIYL